MELDYVLIGNRIKELRIKKNWTQAILAEVAHVEPSNISHIERAATKVRLPTVMDIANALGVTLDDLVYGNLVKSSHISCKRIDELLEDCDDEELKIITEIIKNAKPIIKKYKK